MPAIDQDSRKDYQVHLEILKEELTGKPIGHLVYILTYLILPKNIAELCKWRYKDYNERMGAITCLDRYFYDRYVKPYEEKTTKENGLIIE